MTANRLHNFGPLRDRLEEALSEMFGHRTYLVLMSETTLSPCRSSAFSFAAITGRFLHRALQHDIGGRWSGSGPAMLIDADPLAEMYSVPSDAAIDFTSLACHEAGHIALVPGLFAPDDTQTDACHRAPLAMATERPDLIDALGATRQPRDGHDAAWIRATLHIGHRLRQRGFDISWPMTINASFYGVHPAIYYFRALDGEADRLIGQPLASILSLPPPQPFLDLWNSDLTAWPDGSF